MHNKHAAVVVLSMLKIAQFCMKIAAQSRNYQYEGAFKIA